MLFCMSDERLASLSFTDGFSCDVVAALIWQGDVFMIWQGPPHKMRGLLWEFPGGKTEEGETREEALIRDCR